MKCTIPTGYTLDLVRECFGTLSAFEATLELFSPGCVVKMMDPFLYPAMTSEEDEVQVILQVDCQEDVVGFLCAKALYEGCVDAEEDEIRAYVDTLKFRESDASPT